MKSNKIISVLSIIFIWSAVAIMPVIPAAAAQNRLYFSTDNGSVPGNCESIDIDLIADVDELNPVIATSVNITFDPKCIEITNWAGNTAIWTGGTTNTSAWSLPHGFLSITTVRMAKISGNLNIGTLTLHRKCTEECETCLKFSTGEYTTEGMETLHPIFNNEIFNCTTDSTIEGNGEKEGGAGKSSSGITPNPTTAPSPGPTTSSNPMPTSIPATSPTSTPATTSNPASAPENENGEKPAAPGFGLIISAVTLIAAVYLIRKRGGRY